MIDRTIAGLRPLAARLRRSLHAGVLVLATALAAACGGGELLLLAIPGVGTGGTGIVAGVITGLGSIIVDGERYDEASAALVQQADLGTDETLNAAAFQVGQYVQIELDADGAPARVVLDAQIVGAVSTIDRTQGRLVVLGQTVAVNTDAAQGPVTVFSGATSLADLNVGDTVRIYGTLRANPSQADQERLQASRIEHLGAQTPTLVRVTGTLRGGATTGWSIGGLSVDLANARWLPTGTQAQVAMAVTAVAPWSLAQAAAPSRLAMTSIRALVANTGTGAQRLSGPVRLLGDGQIEVQGVRVDASAAGLAATLGKLDEGAYVTVQTHADANGAVVAKSVERPPSGGRTTELRGTVDSVVGATQFRVRGLVVDASAAEWVGGLASAITDGANVSVQGELTATGVRARRVEWLSTPATHAVVQWTATVQAVTDGRDIVVQATNGQVTTVTLPAGVPPPKPGETIDVLGYWNGTQVTASDIDVRPAVESGTIELRGVLEVLLDGRLRINGQTLQASAEQVLALTSLRGREVSLKVRRTSSGLLQLIELIQARPARP